MAKGFIYWKKCALTGPEIRIAGSARAREILARPRAVQLIRSLNQEAARLIRSWGASPINEAPLETFDIDLTLTNGQTIEGR